MAWLYSEYTIYTRRQPEKKKDDEPSALGMFLGCVILFLIIKGLLH